MSSARAEPTKTMGHGTLDGISETRLIRGAERMVSHPARSSWANVSCGRLFGPTGKPPAILMRSCPFGAQSGI